MCYSLFIYVFLINHVNHQVFKQQINYKQLSPTDISHQHSVCQNKILQNCTNVCTEQTDNSERIVSQWHIQPLSLGRGVETVRLVSVNVPLCRVVIPVPMISVRPFHCTASWNDNHIDINRALCCASSPSSPCLSDVVICQNNCTVSLVTSGNTVFHDPDKIIKFTTDEKTFVDVEIILFYFIKHQRLVPLSIPIKLDKRTHIYTLLMLCGDICPNPGPVRNPCGQCCKPVARNHRAIYCDTCYKWIHMKCANLSPIQYSNLGKSDDPWMCKDCSTFHFSDSFFDTSIDSTNLNHSECSDESKNIFDDLLSLRKKNPNLFLCSHLNINSLRYKFYSIQELLTNNIVDLLFLSETKIDNSFPDATFMVDGFHMWRADRTAHGGGIVAYLRSDIAGERRTDLEFTDIESISVEIKLENSKCLISCVYKPPSTCNNVFKKSFTDTVDKILCKFDNLILIGDMNFDMLDKEKCQTLNDVCDIFDLENVINKPTCFTRNNMPSLLDIILTNNKSFISKTCNFNCGLSDVHNIIGAQLKHSIPVHGPKFRSYRSFKNFDIDKFNQDLVDEMSCLDYNNNVNEIYNDFSHKFSNIADKHAPIKKRKNISKPVPFMNKILKQAIFKKRMLLNKFNKNKTPKNWDNYRKQRNLVTSISRQSMNRYFLERCVGGCKSKDFWPTVKPFLTNKGSNHKKDTILCENSNLITDQQEVCTIFNDFFINVAKDIGNNSIPVNKDHPSIQAISDNKISNDKLNFEPIKEEFISKQICKLSTRKATGHDGISSKLLKLGSPSVLQPITNIINKSFSTSTFPDTLKTAQVIPIHKKNSILDKGNYRPVSILPIISKLFERAINEQLVNFFNQHFHIFLSAFRSGYGCQSALLKITEDWKKALDENQYVAAVLMDLSKAFDCLPHDLLLLKLESYGVSDSALSLLQNYLSNRKQCIKLGNFKSEYQNISKGVPQGSILGPVLFNIFLNDIFYFIQNSILYNYADDNTISKFHHDLKTVIETLENDSQILIQWFSDNKMKANPEKFQAIAIGSKTRSKNISFKLTEEINIKCEEEVKLLGVTIDFRLNFNTHITNICKKASRQLNVLKRIGKHLCKLGKLNIYYSFIMSNFNYCPLTWHFCSEANTQKLENIQKRALRFIYNDYTSTYETLLLNSKLPTLKIRRLRSIALETYKIVNKESPAYLHDLVKIKQNAYSFRYTNTAEMPQVRTTHYGISSFRYGAARLWNSFPQHFRDQTNYNQFRSLVESWDGMSCGCRSCRATS